MTVRYFFVKPLHVSASPYSGGVGAVNPRQAWLSAMHQGQGFHNLPSSGYGVKETLPPSPKVCANLLHII